MNDDYMGNVATIVGDELAIKLEENVVKAMEYVRERVCAVLDSSSVVHEGLSAALPDLPPELKTAVMRNLLEEYNGRLSCFLARVVSQVARQRCETDGQFMRHMLQHLEMTEAHGLPFKIMGYSEEANEAGSELPHIERLIVVPLATLGLDRRDEMLQQAAKKHSSNN